MTLLLPDYRYDLIELVRVLDGDTIEAIVGRDVGFRLTPTWHLRLRLAGVNTPEMRGRFREQAEDARAFTADWLMRERVIVATTGRTTFERWLATITRADGSSLADALVEAGHATRVSC